MSKIKRIVVQLNDREIELSVEEAKLLSKELNGLFGEREKEIRYVHDYWYNRPTWIYPDKWTSGSITTTGSYNDLTSACFTNDSATKWGYACSSVDNNYDVYNINCKTVESMTDTIG